MNICAEYGAEIRRMAARLAEIAEDVEAMTGSAGDLAETSADLDCAASHVDDLGVMIAENE